MKSVNSDKSSKPVKMPKIDKATFLALCAKDKNYHSRNSS